MSLMPVKNFAETTIVGILPSNLTTVTVGSTEKLSNPSLEGSYEAVIWDNTLYQSPHLDPNHEIVLVTSISGTTYTITRAQGGTAAADHIVAGHEYHIGQFLTAKMFTDINKAIQTIPVLPSALLGENLPAGSLVRFTDNGSGTTIALNIAGSQSPPITSNVSAVNGILYHLSDNIFISLSGTASSNIVLTAIQMTTSNIGQILSSVTSTLSRTGNTSIIPINSTTFIVFNSGSGFIDWRVCKLSGSSLSVLNSGTDHYTTTSYTSVYQYGIPLSATQILVWGGGISASIITYNSTTNIITFGPVVSILASTSETYHPTGYDLQFRVSVVNSTTAVFTYIQAGTNNGMVGIITVSGSTITVANAGVQFANNINSGSGLRCSAVCYSSGQIVIGYVDTSLCTNFLVGTINGSTITFGTPTVINTIANTNYYLLSGSSTNVTAIITSTGYLSEVVLSMDGVTITNYILNEYAPSVTYLVAGVLSNGNAVLYTNSSTIITFYTYLGQNLVYCAKFIGITQAAGTNGSTVPIALKGSTSSVHSGLTIGEEYYINPVTGTLTLIPSIYPAGKAISTTKLLLCN